MNTKRLFDTDSHIKSFDAEVTGVREGAVLLSETAFFPEGGGQAADAGTLGGFAVTDVQEEAGGIWHYTRGAFAVGEKVHGVLDWETRLNRMQHHTAEHVVSGIIYEKYGFDNVGFHLTDDGAVFDTSGELSKEQIEEVEMLANAVVWKNVPVTAEYPDEDVLREMQYRSKLELTENVRIVTIEGVDRCACCAPHVKLTGEIGAIKLSDPMRHRGGMRITLYAGKNAVLDYADKYKNVQAIGAMLSARQWETAEAVERLLNENAEKKREIAELKMQIVKLKAESIAGTEGDILIFEDGLDAKAMRELANIAVSKCGGLCMVLSGTDAAGYSYIAASRTADMRAFAKDIAALGGKGGGSKEMVQGRITAKREEIEKFISER